ncbi:hypothetical protein DMB66_46615 [Actinoplanes sp. ATCC 53533]|uniref:hypothetical protein n=1 Tax=Actinoplanes sp. ATCC 53533 TaxID=1288362 RepID=UPI000F78F817|nr:hypothetical protein [Actinoplanes sp. ATCC 53533]RSM48446.1 hypothetical protein DMB66_46615 [Actinoplanes sp. ATCC 53533]
MAAEGGTHTARWRRWAHLSAVVALLFATSVVAATSEVGPGHAPLAIQVVGASGQHAAGQRPDVRVDAGGRPGAVAPDLGAIGWLPARAGAGLAAWWHQRQDVDGHQAQARHEAYQGRGPPGRRAVDAPS